MSKRIPLTRGKFAVIDDEDFERVSKFKWSYTNKKPARSGYATGNAGQRTKQQLARFILRAPKNVEVDHINHNGLDNRKKNLRLVTRSQNKFNLKKYTNNTTGYKGVFRDRRTPPLTKEFLAKISVYKKQINLGRYKTAKEAAAVYNEAALKYHGEYACLNKL